MVGEGVGVGAVPDGVVRWIDWAQAQFNPPGRKPLRCGAAGDHAVVLALGVLACTYRPPQCEVGASYRPYLAHDAQVACGASAPRQRLEGRAEHDATCSVAGWPLRGR